MGRRCVYLRLTADSALLGPTDIKKALVRRVLVVRSTSNTGGAHWTQSRSVCLGRLGVVAPLASTRNSVY
jgi:hypothetical protein